MNNDDVGPNARDFLLETAPMLSSIGTCKLRNDL